MELLAWNDLNTLKERGLPSSLLLSLCMCVCVHAHVCMCVHVCVCLCWLFSIWNLQLFNLLTGPTPRKRWPHDQDSAHTHTHTYTLTHTRTHMHIKEPHLWDIQESRRKTTVCHWFSFPSSMCQTFSIIPPINLQGNVELSEDNWVIVISVKTTWGEKINKWTMSGFSWQLQLYCKKKL